MNEREIFITALEKPTESERNAYLDEVCQRPGVSRGQIEALLREHAQLGAFLETPAGTLLRSANQDAGIRPDQPQRSPGADGWESRVLGDFRILREIGRGGMGIVYEAEQISLGRRMALKVLPFASVLDERHLIRFRNEARAAASLKHLHIVGVHSVGCERGVHYYAMEYIEGQTLAEVIQQRRTCSSGSTAKLEAPTRPDVPPTSAPRSAAEDQRFFRQVAQWGIQAAEGLEHAHQMGIVHRDIKPSNLLVDSTGHLWITDFGLAHIQTDANVTLTGDVLGTLRYMSPEQASGRSRVTDHHTDIYSLGVTLYELLTCRSPFPGDDRQSVLRRIIEEEPPAPRHFSKSIPTDLETIVLKAMAKEPAQRYATAQQLAHDLKRFLTDEPIQARRPSVGDRAAKWSRRHRPLVRSAVAVLLLSTIGSLASALLIAREQKRTVQAYQEKTQQLAATDRAEKLAKQQEQLAKRQELLARKQRELAEAQKKEAVKQRGISDRNLYIAHMRLVQRDWDLGQINRLHEMLDSHIPEPGRPDLRGWDWYYYLSLSHSDLLTLRGHTGPVYSVAWSADGKQLASGAGDGTVSIWNSATGDEILTLTGHQASASSTGTTSSVAWSPDGKLLAYADVEKTVKIWNRDARAVVHTLQAGVIQSLAWSPDGRRLATGIGTTVSVWDIATGQKSLSVRTAGHVGAVSWSPDGSRLACGISGNQVFIWSAVTGEEIVTLRGRPGHPTSIAWNPDGWRLASGAICDPDLRGLTSEGVYGSEVKIWDTRTGQEVVALKGIDSRVFSVAWSPDGRKLASAGYTSIVRISDAGTGEEICVLRGHTSMVRSLAWSPDGARIASASEDRTVRVWDLAREIEVQTLPGQHAVLWLSFSPDGRQLAAAGDEMVAIWDPDAGKIVRRFGNVSGGRYTVAWDPAGEWLAVGDADGVITLWDPATGQERRHWKGHADAIRTLAWSLDGHRLASAGDHGTIKLWDRATWEETHTLRAHGWEVGISWSPDGRRLVSAPNTAEWHARLWNAATGQQVLTRAGVVDGGSAWSPDGRWLALIGSECAIDVFDSAEARRAFRLVGHTGEGKSLAWHPDGTRLASAAEDNTIKIWDTVSKQEILTLHGHTASKFSALVWSPDGRRLAVPNGKDVKLWDATCGYQMVAGPEYGYDYAHRLAAQSQTEVESDQQDEAIAVLQKLADDFIGVAKYRKALAKAYFHRGDRHFHRYDLENAFPDLDRALQYDPKYAEAYEHRGFVHLSRGELDKASADLAIAIEVAPDVAHTWYLRALAQLAAARVDEYRKDCGEMLQRFAETDNPQNARWTAWTCVLVSDPGADWSKAIALAEKAAKSDPKSAQYALTQGAAFYRAGRVQQAIQRLTETEPPRQASDVTSASSPACAWFYLAMAHHRLGHRAEAKNYLDKAVEWMDKETQEPRENTAPRVPWNRRFTVKLLSDEAQALLKTDASQLPESPAQRSETCYLRGRAHADQGELSQAVAAYDEAIQLDPSWADNYGARGDAYARQGDLDRGIADFTTVIRLDPSDVEARINRGSVYVDNGELDKAATDFQEALRTDPLCGQDVVGLAERYRQENQTERATAEYLKAMRLDPQYTGAYLLHSGLVQPGHAKLDQILGDLRQLLRLRNNVTPAWLQWASSWLPAMTRGTDKLPGIVFATDLPWVRSTCGWGPKSAVRNGYTAGGTLRIAGLPYAEAVWTHAFADTTPADVVLDVSGQKFATFKVDAGVERTGSVQFQVLADGKVRYETPVLRFGTVQPICVDVAGVKEVVLRVRNGSDGNTYDSAGWGFARFVQAGAEDPLEEPGELHSATDANAALFLAEVHWRLDQKDLARRWYAKAVEWMDKNQAESEKLRGYREEAAELLGIAAKPATAQEQPEKP